MSAAASSIDTREAYYVVLIETDARPSNTAAAAADPAGMGRASRSLTGHKTVLQYLLKPINKTQDEAFHEL